MKKIKILKLFLFFCLILSGNLKLFYQNSTNYFNSIKIDNKTFLSSLHKDTKPLFQADSAFWTKTAIHEAAHGLFVLIYPKKEPYPEFVNNKNEKEPAIDFESLSLDIDPNISWNGTALITKNLQKPEINSRENFFIYHWWALMLVSGYIGVEVFTGKIESGNDNIKVLGSFVMLAQLQKKHEIKDKIINWENNNLEKGMILGIRQTAKKIISKPQHLKTILLLAKALFIVKKLKKKDMLYIYKNHKLPPKILEEKKKMTSKIKFDENIILPEIKTLIQKANQLEILFQKFKNASTPNISLDQNKFPSSQFTILLKEKHKTSIGNLSDEAISELKTLQNDLDKNNKKNKNTSNKKIIIGLSVSFGIVFILIGLIIIRRYFVSKKKKKQINQKPQT